MKILDYEGLTYLIEKIKGLLSKKADITALTPIETSISDLSDQLGDIISRLEALETVGGE